MEVASGVRRRREPESGVLYRVVQAAWSTFVQRVESGQRVVPQFCIREKTPAVEAAPAVQLEAWIVTRGADGKGKFNGKGEFHRVALTDAQKPLSRIQQLARDWRRQILDGNATRGRGTKPQPGDPAGELDGLVWTPVQAKLGNATTFVVCLDDDLHQIPFEELPSLRDKDVRLAQSLVELLQPLPPPAAGPPTLCIVGGLDFDRLPGADPKDASATAAAATVDPRRGSARLGGAEKGVKSIFPLGRLDGTKTEFAAIQRWFGHRHPGATIQAATGGEATRDWFVRCSQQADYLHIGTHGYCLQDEQRQKWVQVVAPMALCGLALSGANKTCSEEAPEFFGLISGEEIAGLDLRRCRLAVLSACSTYKGEVRAGHGVASLQAAFHAAGAQRVIASRWDVPDGPTAKLMERFFAKLFEGRSARQALAAAKEQMRGDPDTAAMKNWAGFVLTGGLLDVDK